MKYYGRNINNDYNINNNNNNNYNNNDNSCSNNKNNINTAGAFLSPAMQLREESWLKTFSRVHDKVQPMYLTLILPIARSAVITLSYCY